MTNKWMKFSEHNIISKIHESDDYFIVNLLSGNADILSAEEVKCFLEDKVVDNQVFVDRGYIVDPLSEAKLYRSKYLDFLDSRDSDEIQIFYAPTYNCNFNCSYCYQEGYQQNPDNYHSEVVTAFFDYIRKNFSDKRKYVTLFGGEPLLDSKQNRLFLEQFLKSCQQLNIETAIVTNGNNLNEFIPLLTSFKIREVQVTLDGPEEIHDSRRHLKNGQGTFRNIVSGIDSLIKAHIPVNLRVVLDKDNIEYLPELSLFAINRKWTSSSLFKTQLGRNYELHRCQSQQSKLYSRIELYKDIHRLIKKYPYILQFHKPAFSISKFLFENEELPEPLFDSCPGCKTEWAFDYTGRIYSCTATVGKAGEEIGTFYPQTELNKDKVLQWQQRDVLSIDDCKKCNLSLACGGGCASVAYNKLKNICAPDCRPVKELMELGFSLYTNLKV